jgi:hypothetical protein
VEEVGVETGRRRETSRLVGGEEAAEVGVECGRGIDRVGVAGADMLLRGGSVSGREEQLCCSG